MGWFIFVACALANGWNEYSTWPVASDVEVAGAEVQLVLPYGWAPEHYQMLDDEGRELVLVDYLEVLSGDEPLSQRVGRVRRQARQHRRTLERWQRYHWDQTIEDLLLGFVSLEVEAATVRGDQDALDAIARIPLGGGRRLRLAQRSLVTLGRPMLADVR